MKGRKYLPLGSVVIIKNANKKIMIIGYSVINNDDQKKYDYAGCLYPEGMLNSTKILIFNHEDIQEIFDYGYADIKYNKFNEILNKNN